MFCGYWKPKLAVMRALVVIKKTNVIQCNMIQRVANVKSSLFCTRKHSGIEFVSN